MTGQPLDTSGFSLEDWLGYISSAHPSEIDLGLERVAQVWHRLHDGRPVAKRVVTVAGTNGKGSTVAMLERVLLAAGLKVGAYTSPHIEQYNERVRLNGICADDRLLTQGFAEVERARGDVPLTYFEFGTLAALWLLACSKLDVALLEVGLGGRLDAVNIVDADIAVITSIALDHADWLGSDLEVIGLEKSGIMRAGRPVVVGQDVTRSVVSQAEHLSCPTYRYGVEFGLDQGQVYFDVGGFSGQLDWAETTLPVSNVLVALAVSQLLLHHFEALNDGLDSAQSRLSIAAQTKVSGRMESLPGFEYVYLDVGHNAHAAGHLKLQIDRLARKHNRNVVAVYSSLADKEPGAVAKVLASSVDVWFVAELQCERAMPIAELEKQVGQYAKDMVSFDSITAALQTAVEQHGADALILVFGSFFVVEAAKAFFSDYE